MTIISLSVNSFSLISPRLFTNFEPENQSAPVQECPSYIDAGGCDLQANKNQTIDILFNGTLDGKPVRNIFERILAKGMQRQYSRSIMFSWAEMLC